MRNFFSRFHPRYPRILVYMLQQSEYNIRDYLSWLASVRDFSKVERRKKFTPTLKAVLLLSSAWVILAVIIALAIGGLFLFKKPENFIFFFALFLLAPYLLACLIIIPLLGLNAAQFPVEMRIMNRARKKLSAHRGLRIAIAGSYGKTSMREILRAVLSAGKKVAAPPHSYNTPLGIARFINTLKGDEDLLIFEFGEYYPGDVKKLCRIVAPEIGIITGVNEAHLQKFKALQKTAKTIFELAQFVAPQNLYINEESAAAKEKAAPGNFLYSRKGVWQERLEWKIENAASDLSGTSFNISNPIAGINLQLHSHLLGLHQVGPLALAVALAARLKISPEKIKEGIAAARPFEHRLEPIQDAHGAITLDDSYNGNPDGAAAVIDFLSTLKGRRRFYVTPGLVEMGARTEEVHKEIGRALAVAGIEKVVLIRDSVTPYIERGLKENNYKGDIIWFDDALAALAALPSMSAAGDVFLIQNDWPDQYR